MTGRSDSKGALMAVLYRGMKDDGEGEPMCGPSARMLGVRPYGDLPISEDGMVAPETGGMSVALDDAQHLPPHRRPPEFGGHGDDPVWQIEEADLPDSLTLRRDPDNPSRHGFIEPIEVMALSDYQEALATSRGIWSRA
jgi:hypothetical protein